MIESKTELDVILGAVPVGAVLMDNSLSLHKYSFAGAFA